MAEKDIEAPEADAYDKLFQQQLDTDSKQRLTNQWNRRGFYDIAARFLPADKPIIEIGCGDGFFTNFIGKRGYTGIDFCKVLVNHGRKLYPNRKLIEGDARTKEIQDMFTSEFAYVSLETLEHIKDDISVIESIPVGADFVFSVPSADNQFHVRYFNSFDEIKNRYKDCLDFFDQDQHATNYNNVIRVMKSRRK